MTPKHFVPAETLHVCPHCLSFIKVNFTVEKVVFYSLNFSIFTEVSFCIAYFVLIFFEIVPRDFPRPNLGLVIGLCFVPKRD